MTAFDWLTFLQGFSEELLADEAIREAQPKAAVRAGWMGFKGAAAEDIASLEDRLQVDLPPSYRAFLSVSNCWRNTGYFIDRLLPTTEVEWFRERFPEWMAAYVRSYENLRPITDEEYFVYGEAQESTAIRTAYLEASLAISAHGDSVIYLLNPEVKSPEGEWEAWFFGDWIPGAERHRSFQELMVVERKAFQQEGGPG